MNRIKGLILIMVAMIFVVCPLAADVDVTWEWYNDDPAVQYFRYQIDGENENGWTVVPSNVTSYTASNLDGNQSYGLYLQQSYDGIWWSESAVAYSEVVQDIVPPVASLTATTVNNATYTAAPVPAVPEAQPAQVEVIAAEPAPKAPGASTSNPADAPVGEKIGTVKTTNKISFGVDLGYIKLPGGSGGLGSLNLDVDNVFKSRVDATVSIGVLGIPTMGLKDLITKNLTKIFNSDTWYKGFYGELLIGAHKDFKKTQVSLGVGPRIVFGKEGEVINKGNSQNFIRGGYKYDLGVAVQANADWLLSKRWSLGLSAFANYMFISKGATFGAKGAVRFRF